MSRCYIEEEGSGRGVKNPCSFGSLESDTGRGDRFGVGGRLWSIPSRAGALRGVSVWYVEYDFPVLLGRNSFPLHLWCFLCLILEFCWPPSIYTQSCYDWWQIVFDSRFLWIPSSWIIFFLSFWCGWRHLSWCRVLDFVSLLEDYSFKDSQFALNIRKILKL